MIFTLISFVAFGVVLRGLYFFSAGRLSPAGIDVLWEGKDRHNQKEIKAPVCWEWQFFLRLNDLL